MCASEKEDEEVAILIKNSIIISTAYFQLLEAELIFIKTVITEIVKYTVHALQCV